MATSYILSAAVNILEAATVYLSTGSANSLYPLYRLYDRDIGKSFISTSATAIAITVDQGATVTAVDRLIIPAGHNLNGATMTLQYSSNGTSWTNAVSWTQADSLLINKAFTAVSYRYWKLSISYASAKAWQMTELFLMPTYTWNVNPDYPGGPFDVKHNVERKLLASGGVRYLKRGDPKRKREYSVPYSNEAQAAAIEDLNDKWAGCKPFWLCDHRGEWVYGELTKEIGIQETEYQLYSYNFDFLEVLPA
jgi:hypothetical protein